MAQKITPEILELKESIITKLTLLIMDQPEKSVTDILRDFNNLTPYHRDPDNDTGNIISAGDKKFDRVLDVMIKSRMAEVSNDMMKNPRKYR